MNILTTHHGMIYRPDWPDTATLYVGQQGTLPPLRSVLLITNAYDDTTRKCVVISRHLRTHEYTVWIP